MRVINNLIMITNLVALFIQLVRTIMRLKRETKRVTERDSKINLIVWANSLVFLNNDIKHNVAYLKSQKMRTMQQSEAIDDELQMCFENFGIYMFFQLCIVNSIKKWLLIQSAPAVLAMTLREQHWLDFKGQYVIQISMLCPSPFMGHGHRCTK